MSDGKPRCVKCGYLLVGMPAPQRCPECGHAVVRRERWVEGELHLEGPDVVLPIFMRTLMAALILTVGFLGGHALNPSLLNWLEIGVQWDPRWAMLPMALAAPLACLLWSRPIDTRDAGLLGLNSGASWRSMLPVWQLVWVAYALCVVVAIANPPQPATAQTPLAAAAPTSGTAGTTPMNPPDLWMAIACMLGIAAQLPWILTLRHLGRIAEYLREPLLLRIAKIWTWVWSVGLALSLTVGIGWASGRGAGSGSSRQHFFHFLGDILETLSSAPTGTSVLERVLVFSNLGLVIGTVLAWMLFWLMAHSLTIAHETMARDQRRVERERDRYFTPE